MLEQLGKVLLLQLLLYVKKALEVLEIAAEYFLHLKTQTRENL